MNNWMIKVAVLTGIIALTACSAESENREEEAISTEKTTEVYSAMYSQTGKFTVVKDENGFLSVGVSGDIDNGEKTRVFEAIAQPKLVDIYRSLFGKDAQLPRELNSVSAQFDEQMVAVAKQRQALDVSSTADEETAIENQAKVAPVKSYADFQAKACTTVPSGYQSDECSSFVTCPNLIWGKCSVYTQKYHYSGDIICGWNNTGVSAYIYTSSYIKVGGMNPRAVWCRTMLYHGVKFEIREDAGVTQGELGISAFTPIPGEMQ